MSSRGNQDHHGLRWNLGTHGFVLYPKTYNDSNGLYATGSPYKYGYSLDEDNTQKNEQFDAINYGVNNTVIYVKKVKEEVDIQSGNQFFYSGQNVYSWWHSPCGDGPLPVSSNRIDTVTGDPDVSGQLSSGGVRQVAAFGVYSPFIFYTSGFYYHLPNTDVLEKVPRCIYKNGKQIEIKGIPFVNSAPSSSNMVCGFFYGTVTLNDNTTARRYMVMRSVINSYPSYGLFPLVKQSLSIDSANDSSSIPVNYSAASDLAFPEYTTDKIVDLCLWPWRFNSTGSEVCSLSVRCYVNDEYTDVYQTTMVVVRIPITHYQNLVSVGDPIIEEYHYRYDITSYSYDYLSRTSSGGMSQDGKSGSGSDSETSHFKSGYKKSQSSDFIPIAINYNKEDIIKIAIFSCTSDSYDDYLERNKNISTNWSFSQYETEGDEPDTISTTNVSGNYSYDYTHYKNETLGGYSISINNNVLFERPHTTFNDYLIWSEVNGSSYTDIQTRGFMGGNTIDRTETGIGHYTYNQIDHTVLSPVIKNYQNYEHIFYISVNGKAVKHFIHTEGSCIEEHTDSDTSYSYHLAPGIDEVSWTPITVTVFNKYKTDSNVSLYVNNIEQYNEVIEEQQTLSTNTFESSRGGGLPVYSLENPYTVDNSVTTNVDHVINVVFNLFGYQRIYNEPYYPRKKSIIVNSSTTFDFRPNSNRYENPFDPLWIDTTHVKYAVDNAPFKKTAYSIPVLSAALSYESDTLLELCPIGLY